MTAKKWTLKEIQGALEKQQINRPEFVSFKTGSDEFGNDEIKVDYDSWYCPRCDEINSRYNEYDFFHTEQYCSYCGQRVEFE